MTTLFVGDVHGCSEELRELLDQVGPHRVVLLGDLFTKGPDPLGVWRLIEEIAPECVLGNHDASVLSRWGEWAGRGLPEAARDWLLDLPMWITGPGWIAVHAGLHPVLGIAGTSRSQAMVLRRWPDDQSTKSPFWWELYQGSSKVIYGHDAARGLVDRRPRTLGLDTGCVYGGRLTGYLLESDRVVSVPARKVWWPAR